eukprot:COSAG01_NODE_23862_length_799_cov_1.001429_1_plen_52_part_00
MCTAQLWVYPAAQLRRQRLVLAKPADHSTLPSTVTQLSDAWLTDYGQYTLT